MPTMLLTNVVYCTLFQIIKMFFQIGLRTPIVLSLVAEWENNQNKVNLDIRVPQHSVNE